ncbi:MAG: hypothetical protein ACI4V7_02830 [Succinivibrionaceae bacterium]
MKINTFMNVKKILELIQKNNFYNTSLYLSLGIVGSQGVMFQGGEYIQALGTAAIAISAWQITKCQIIHRIQERKGKLKKGENIDDELIDIDNFKIVDIDLKLNEKISKIINSNRCDLEYTQKCYDIGISYLKGRGLPISFEKSFNNFLKGARAGSAKCAVELAHFYRVGKFVPKNEFLAKYWYEFAAMNDNTEACIQLSDWYIRNHESEKSNIRIHYFLDKAQRLGHSQAQNIKTKLLQEQKIHPLTVGDIKELKTSADIKFIYDFSIHKNLRKFIFKGGMCKPSDLLQAYKVLGFVVPSNLEIPNISLEDIRRSYHTKIKQIHPDIHRQTAEDKVHLIKLNTAYQLLVKLYS